MKYIPIFLLTILANVAVAQTDGKWDLTNCIDYALENNITVKQAALNKNSAEVALTRSEDQRYPDLNGGVSLGLTNGSSIDPITSDYVSKLISSSNFSLSSQATLYSGGQMLRQIDQNKLLVEQNDLYVEEAKNNITLSIVDAYLQALFIKENINVARNNLTTSTRQLEQAKARYEYGEIAAKDVAEVESQFASNQYSLVTAENAFAQQVLTLKQLLELDPGTPFSIDTTTTMLDEELAVPEMNEVYRTALASMPQIQASELEMDISNLDLVIANAGYKPTLTASARLYSGYTSTQDIDFFQQLDGNFNQSVGLTLNVPIFDKKQTASQVQNALIGIERAKLNQVSVTKELYRNIETAWQNASASIAETRSAKAVWDASKIAYDMAQQQYELGVVSATDLLVSQNSYINAEQQYLQTKYSGILYYSLLQFYLGNEIKI